MMVVSSFDVKIIVKGLNGGLCLGLMFVYLYWPYMYS